MPRCISSLSQKIEIWRKGVLHQRIETSIFICQVLFHFDVANGHSTEGKILQISFFRSTLTEFMLLTDAFPSSDITSQTPESIYCKFLFSREQFLFRHISLPDVPDRLSAIGHEGRYYSLFRTVSSAQDALKLCVKASIKGNEVAITQAGDRYILWVYEADAVLASSNQAQVAMPSSHRLLGADLKIGVMDTFSSAPCLVIVDPKACQFCYFAISGQSDRQPGFRYKNRCYGLVQREPDALKAVAAIAERACRGIELAIVPSQKGYGIFTLEQSLV